MKKIIFLLIILLPIKAICQQSITGKVLDSKSKKPIGGAIITATGSSNGATSKNNGQFKIKFKTVAEPKINPKAKIKAKAKVKAKSKHKATVTSITISHEGYKAQTILLADLSTVNEIVLEPLVEIAPIIEVGSIASRKTNGTNVPAEIISVASMAKQLGQTDLSQILAFTSASLHSGRQTNAGESDQQDPVSFRGMGTDQVLVLVNGKRRHQSALVNVNETFNRGQVGTDLNAIPVSAIEKVEILKDGEATRYGSDAIAGVINIVLKQAVNTLTGSISTGGNLSSYDKNYALNKLSNSNSGKIAVQDGGTLQAGLNYGFKLKNNGFINLTGEYGIRSLSNRTGTYTGQLFPLAGGRNQDDSILAARSLTRNNFDTRIGNAKITNGALMLNSAINFSKSWSLNIVGGLSQRQGESGGFYRYPSTIFTDAGTYANQVLAIYPNGFLPLLQTTIQDLSFSAGLNGKIAKWNFSLSNTSGANMSYGKVINTINYTQLAVTPAPIQQFRTGNAQFLQNTTNLDILRNIKVLAGLQLGFGAAYRVERYQQMMGAEPSYTSYNNNAGALGGTQGFAGFNPAYVNAHYRNNAAGYINLEQNITKRWMIALAARYEDYSDFGLTTLNYKTTPNYKIGSQLKIGKGLILRASGFTTFRAPSLQELFYTKNNSSVESSLTGLVPVQAVTFTDDSRAAQILGIAALKPETAQNYSAGFTVNFSKQFEIAIDGYLVDIKNRIGLTNNFIGGANMELAQILNNNGATAANFFTNAIDTRSKGAEATLTYHTVYGNLSRLKLVLSAAYNDNEVVKGSDKNPKLYTSSVLANSGQIGNYFNREDQGRLEMALPKIKGNFAVFYNHKSMGIMVRVAYFGKVSYLDPSVNPLDGSTFPLNAFTGLTQTLDETFGAKAITDLSINFNINKNFSLTLGANNIFDVYPDVQTHYDNVSLGRFNYNRQVQQMGSNGRYAFGKISYNIKTKK